MRIGQWPMANGICHWSLANSHMSFQALSIPRFPWKFDAPNHLCSRQSYVLALPILIHAQVSARAKQVHERAIVIDSRDDTTQRLLFDNGACTLLKKGYSDRASRKYSAATFCASWSRWKS